MRVLFTGGASPLGARVLRCLIKDEAYDEVWCGKHLRDVPLTHPKLRQIELRLEKELDLSKIPAPLDLVIHFAAVTQARNETEYWDINFRGTQKLAESARALGCRRFVYISTRCATAGSGAYGESKWAAEAELRKLDWDSLLILRPAEIYGAGGRGGLDRFLQLAERFHVAPWLWGHEGLRLAPLQVEDFVSVTCALLAEHRRGRHVLDICGPENLDGATLAWRIARRYRALPLPLWWPALVLVLSALRRVGLAPVSQDQVARLVGSKTASQSTPDPILNREMNYFLRD
jgi:nucleoside-diphosphate-sugar epimerase